MARACRRAFAGAVAAGGRPFVPFWYASRVPSARRGGVARVRWWWRGVAVVAASRRPYLCGRPRPPCWWPRPPWCGVVRLCWWRRAVARPSRRNITPAAPAVVVVRWCTPCRWCPCRPPWTRPAVAGVVRPSARRCGWWWRGGGVTFSTGRAAAGGGLGASVARRRYRNARPRAWCGVRFGVVVNELSTAAACRPWRPVAELNRPRRPYGRGAHQRGTGAIKRPRIRTRQARRRPRCWPLLRRQSWQ